MSYSVRIKHSAEQALNRMPKADRERVDRKILALAENPRPEGAIPLKGAGRGFGESGLATGESFTRFEMRNWWY